MNRKKFFDLVRRDLFDGKLAQGQVEGIGRIIDYRASNWPKMIDEELAYVLATVKWETGHSMQPVEEGYPATGAKLRAYQKKLRYYPWYGRGLVQITWASNYLKFGIEKPEDALTWPIALRALFEGCIKGMFTGHKLADYISARKQDYVSARRVVNGLDKADRIAEFAKLFLFALKRADDGTEDHIPSIDLRPLQERLLSLGYALGKLDGVYAELTAGAVARFQFTNKLPITGAFDQVTIERLMSDDAIRSQVQDDREQATVDDLPESRTIGAAKQVETVATQSTVSALAVVVAGFVEAAKGGNAPIVLGLFAVIWFVRSVSRQKALAGQVKAARLDDYRSGKSL